MIIPFNLNYLNAFWAVIKTSLTFHRFICGWGIPNRQELIAVSVSKFPSIRLGTETWDPRLMETWENRDSSSRLDKVLVGGFSPTHLKICASQTGS